MMRREFGRNVQVPDRIHRNACEDGILSGKPRTGRPRSARTEANTKQILKEIAEHPTTSTRAAASQLHISRRKIQRVLHNAKFHPYVLHLTHEITAEDEHDRLHFCEEMLASLTADSDLLSKLIFTDKSIFHLSEK